MCMCLIVAMNKVSNWTPDEVWKWLQNKSFFKGFDPGDWDDVTGQNLLSMNKEELREICPLRFRIESLLEAIDQLKQKGYSLVYIVFMMESVLDHL